MDKWVNGFAISLFWAWPVESSLLYNYDGASSIPLNQDELLAVVFTLLNAIIWKCYIKGAFFIWAHLLLCLQLTDTHGSQNIPAALEISSETA